LINGAGIYSVNDETTDCKWRIEFIKNALLIKTIGESDNCGFGGGVYADGTFTRTENKCPDFFETHEGMIYFKDIK
jgi:hypothetical protein